MSGIRTQSFSESTRLALKQAYEHLHQASPTPITTGDLALAAKVPVDRARRILAGSSWWTTELAAAAHKEAYRRSAPRFLLIT